MLRILAAGLLVGFAIAASPGPIWFLCTRRSLTQGWASGFVSGLGVATADGFYGAVAAFGMAAVAGWLVRESVWLRLTGGLVLAILGLHMALSRPAAPDSVGRGVGGLAANYVSMLGLTLTNPTTVVSFVAVGAGLGITAREGWLPAAVLVAGVTAGSAVWWLLLTGLLHRIRGRLPQSALRTLSVAAGSMITLLGLAAVVGAVVSVWPVPLQIP